MTAPLSLLRPFLILCCLLLLPFPGLAGSIEPFVGSFAGQATFEEEGKTQKRDMSTTIREAGKGFSITWTSVTYRSDGRTTTKTYTVDFVPSQRENIYQAAMKSNLFGKAVPLDPLAGEPFVWARIVGDTFSLYSLFINEAGEYEIQEFHRTLVDEGLDLVFLRVRNGAPQREIRTLLKRTE